MWLLSRGNNLWGFQCNNVERMQWLFLVMLWNLYQLFVVKCSQCVIRHVANAAWGREWHVRLRIAQSTGFEMGNPIWGDDVVTGNFCPLDCATHVRDGYTEVNNRFHKAHNMVPNCYVAHNYNSTVWITQVLLYRNYNLQLEFGTII